MSSVGGEQLPVIVGSHVDGSWYDCVQILSQDLTDDMNLDSVEGCEMPLLVPEDPKSKSTLDITNLFKIMSKSNLNCSDTLLAKLAEQLKGLFSVEDLKQVQNLFTVYKDYLNGESPKINVSRTKYVFEHKERTLELVNQINSSDNAKELIVEGENKTVEMTDENDEFFITVPSYYELSISECPLPPNVYDPYRGNSILQTPSYKKSGVDVKIVEGDSANNDLEIQPNEKRYYNALFSLMKQGLSKEFPDKDPDECLEENIGSQVVKDYLTNIALYGLFMNWRHTGCVPVNLNEELCDVSDLDVENEDDDNTENDGTGKRAFYDEPKSVFTDYSELIRDLCNSIFNANPKLLIEFAIKMNRFGSKKPTRLKLPNGKYLDLNSHRIMNGSGNYSQSEEVVDEEGNNAELVAVVNFNSYMSDKEYMRKHNIVNKTIDMPVGLCCRKYYNSGESKLIFTSFIDVIQSYKDGSNRLKIKGIKYDPNKDVFTSDDDSLLSNPKFSLGEAIESVAGGGSSFYNYDGFVEAFMDKSVYDPRLSILKIMKDYYSSDNLSVLETFKYDSLEELDELIKVLRLPPRGIIEKNIATYVLTILDGANNKYVNEYDPNVNFGIEDFINYFNYSMEYIDFSGKFGNEDFLNKKPNVQTSNAFGKAEQSDEEEDEDMSKKLISTDTTDMMFAEVVLTKDDYEVLKDKVKIENLGEKNTSINKVSTPVVLIGYIALKLDPETRKPKGDKVFMNTSFKPEKHNAVLDARKLTPALVDNVTAMMNGKEPSYKYESQEACNYFCGIIAALTNYYLRK